MSELAFVSVSAFPTREIVAGFTIRQAVSGIISSCIQRGLLTHDYLPYLIERAVLRMAESLSLEVTLWQSCLVVGRGCHKASVFVFCEGSNRDLVILRSQPWNVWNLGGQSMDMLLLYPS